MKVNVLFFASCRDLVGSAEREMDLPDGATVGDLMIEIASEHPRFREMVPSLMVSVNQDYRERSDVLREGDEVALIPPVSGGA